MGEMKTTVRMHKHPLKSAGFRVLKAPDVPSVLVELGYVSNKGDLEHLVSENWRTGPSASMAQAIDAFFAKRLVSAGHAELNLAARPSGAEALVWPQRRRYRKVARSSESAEIVAFDAMTAGPQAPRRVRPIADRGSRMRCAAPLRRTG